MNKKFKQKQSQSSASHSSKTQTSKFYSPSNRSYASNTSTNPKGTQQGLVKRHPDGFGFFIPDDPEFPDVYIPRNSMEGVMTQDRVLVRVEKERGTQRFRGDIVKILSRGQSRVVGQFKAKSHGGGYLKDDNKGWGSDLEISPADTLSAKENDLVAVEIISYPDQDQFTGKVVKVIGDIADPMNDIQRVLFTQNIPHEWNPETLKEAERFKEEVDPKDIRGRKDLRDKAFITIDGATAKDFDDAILVESSKQGWILWVAIADVSHYVKPGTAMDAEAFERGNSVYFPNFVVPMLPEKLSNGLCSLNPKVDRLVLVAEIHMDFNGQTQKTDFYEAVIHSQARVIYGEAQEILEGGSIAKLKHVENEIKRAGDLAKILMTKRFREGSLDLEIPEIQILVDETGTPVDIAKHDRLFAHRLIEEMMLSANVAVATFLSEKQETAFYRVHESPNPQALTMLEKYLHNFGSAAKLSGGSLQKRLTKALEEFSGKPEAQILNILTLRSMAQAKYSLNNQGHFGLGFQFYTHFTSPIRRYPDLIVHRLLKNQIDVSGYANMSEGDLATAGTMLSATEQRAAKSERQHQSIKKARYMEKYIGEEFDGIISSVTKFGIFVLVRPMEVDGLVSIEKLNKNQRDKMEFDEENLRLVQRRSGRAFEIGDRIRIKVTDTNTALGQIDFELAEGQEAPEKNAVVAAKKDRRPQGPKSSRDFKDSRNFKKAQTSFQGSKEERSEGRKKNPRPDKDFEKRFSGKGKSHRKGSNKKNQHSEKDFEQEAHDFSDGRSEKRQSKKSAKPKKSGTFYEKFTKKKAKSESKGIHGYDRNELKSVRRFANTDSDDSSARPPKTNSGEFDIEEKLRQLRARGGSSGGVQGLIKVRQNLQFKSKSGSARKSGGKKKRY